MEVKIIIQQLLPGELSIRKYGNMLDPVCLAVLLNKSSLPFFQEKLILSFSLVPLHCTPSGCLRCSGYELFLRLIFEYLTTQD